MCTYASSSGPNRSSATPPSGSALAAGSHPAGAVYGCANRRALTSLLRGKWNMSGFVVSDCGAVHDAASSLTAGCDLECPFGAQSNAQFNKLANLSRAGTVLHPSTTP